jgi:hypothetical protein
MDPFSPQHETADPPDATAHTDAKALTASDSMLLTPATAMGVVEHGLVIPCAALHVSGPVRVPAPSSPNSLSPQHAAVPSVKTAQYS